jgi:hypothetical protein
MAQILSQTARPEGQHKSTFSALIFGLTAPSSLWGNCAKERDFHNSIIDNGSFEPKKYQG